MLIAEFYRLDTQCKHPPLLKLIIVINSYYYYMMKISSS